MDLLISIIDADYSANEAVDSVVLTFITQISTW